MLSCTRSSTPLAARLQFGRGGAAKRASVAVAVRAAKIDDDDAEPIVKVDVGVDLSPSNLNLVSRRGALFSAVASAPLAAFFSTISLPATAAVATKKLPKLDPIKLFGSEDAAELARAAAVAGVRKTLASVDPSSGGVLLRMAFHDAGTWDGAKMTGGANGSLLNELERPENGKEKSFFCF